MRSLVTAASLPASRLQQKNAGVRPGLEEARLHDNAAAVLQHAQLGVRRIADRQQVAALLLRSAAALSTLSLTIRGDAACWLGIAWSYMSLRVRLDVHSSQARPGTRMRILVRFGLGLELRHMLAFL